MRNLLTIIALLGCAYTMAYAQQTSDVVPADLNSMMENRGAASVNESRSLVNLQFFRYNEPEMYEGEEMWVYLMPELPVFPPMKFKNEKQRLKWNKMVNNIKRVLPLAQEVKLIIGETYQVLQTMPTEKEKNAHIKAVEKDIKRQFTPEMKRLTYSQGKLLIKLVDRECNQSSYEIVKAFLGPTRAAFYQVFAWSFGASLKKDYRPEDDDKLIERIVLQIEAGQL